MQLHDWLLLILMVVDQTQKNEVIAVSEVEEQIVQTTTDDILSLYNSNQNLDLDPIKSKLHEKPFLMLLRQTTGIHSETQRRLMLVSYYEHFAPVLQSLPATTSDSSALTNPTTEYIIIDVHLALMTIRKGVLFDPTRIQTFLRSLRLVDLTQKEDAPVTLL